LANLFGSDMVQKLEDAASGEADAPFTTEEWEKACLVVRATQRESNLPLGVLPTMYFVATRIEKGEAATKKVWVYAMRLKREERQDARVEKGKAYFDEGEVRELERIATSATPEEAKKIRAALAIFARARVQWAAQAGAVGAFAATGRAEKEAMRYLDGVLSEFRQAKDVKRSRESYDKKTEVALFEKAVEIIGVKRQRELLKAAQLGRISGEAYLTYMRLMGKYKSGVLPNDLAPADLQLFAEATKYTV
jgi:hypothetical protein